MRTLPCVLSPLFAVVLASCATPAQTPEQQGKASPPVGQGPAGQDPATQAPPPAQSGNGQPVVVTNKGRPIPKGCWFKKIHHDFGSFVEGEGDPNHEAGQPATLLAFEYEFKNLSGKPAQVTSVVPSCKCQRLAFLLGDREIVLERKDEIQQRLKKPIKVPAGAEGKILMHFDIAGGPGVRTGDIRVDTTDSGMPSCTLTCEAKVTPAYEITPPVVTLGMMGPMEEKKWSCNVRCLVRKEWRVIEALPPIPHGLRVRSIERKKDAAGLYYAISGTYGPNLEEGAVGGNLLFKTDNAKQNFMLEIRAQVRETVQMTPIFFSFASFPRNEPQERTIHLWPTDLEDPKAALDVDRVEIERSTVPKKFLTFEIVPPAARVPDKAREMVMIESRQKEVPADKLWKVKVRLEKDVPGRLVRVKARVLLKGKGMVPKNFQFNGFPRRPR